MTAYKRSEIKATLSVTNIQYTGTLTVNSDYEQYSLCRNLLCSEKARINQSTLLDNYLEDPQYAKFERNDNFSCDDFNNDYKSHYDKSNGDVESCIVNFGNSDKSRYEKVDSDANWFVTGQHKEHSRDSYVNDEELKEVFAQFKSAVISTSNSEVSVCRTPSDATFESSDIQSCPKQWDTEKWKAYYDSHRSQEKASMVIPEDFELSADRRINPEISSKQLRETKKDFFEKVKFNREILEKLKFRKSKSDIIDEDGNNLENKTLLNEKPMKRKFKKYTYTDHETWLFENLTPEQIEAYRKHQKLKLTFTPGFLSRRVSNKLKHTEVHEATRPNQFKKLSFKYEPHEKFPAFGEGNYTTTAVSKNYTFTTTEQMEINRANYALDQRLLKMKNRKSTLKASAQKQRKIELDQTSSYINRMKEYRRINIENEKIAKKFNPNQISTTLQLMNRRSVPSCDNFSLSSKSSSAQFSSKIYTKAYEKKTVQRLAHSKNQYASDKSPSKIPKKYKRPEWTVGHVDYKKTEVKPIKYKSIRKLPLSFSISSSTCQSKSSKRSESSNTYRIPIKPKTAPILGSANSTENKNKHGEVTEYGRSLSEQNNMPHRNLHRTQNIANKSRIPIRRLNNARSMDLNDKKFKVFQTLNEALFGSHQKESSHKNVHNKNELKAGQTQKQVEKTRTGDNIMSKECREFENVEDTNISSLEMGGGDATRVLICTDHNNNGDATHQTCLENDCLKQSFDLLSENRIDQFNFDLSDLEETLSKTSSVSMEQELDSSSYSPRFSSPKRTFMEATIKSTSFSSLGRMSFSNTLDIISEITESSDDEKNYVRADLNCHLDNVFDEHNNLTQNSRRRKDVSDVGDSFDETSEIKFPPQINHGAASNLLKKVGNIDEENLCLDEIHRVKIAARLNQLNVAPKPLPDGNLFNIVNAGGRKVTNELYKRNRKVRFSEIEEDVSDGNKMEDKDEDEDQEFEE